MELLYKEVSQTTPLRPPRVMARYTQLLILPYLPKSTANIPI